MSDRPLDALAALDGVVLLDSLTATRQQLLAALERACVDGSNAVLIVSADTLDRVRRARLLEADIEHLRFAEPALLCHEPEPMREPKQTGCAKCRRPITRGRHCFSCAHGKRR